MSNLSSSALADASTTPRPGRDFAPGQALWALGALGFRIKPVVGLTGMAWGRQYLVLHTGNRVDAVLDAAVWEHLLRLPPRYFEARPTGVVAARLHAIETIRGRTQPGLCHRTPGRL